MSNQNRDLEDIMSDLNHINSEFRQKVQAGTSDPDNFMKLHEIERLWKELRISTEKIYSEQVMSLIADIDESVLILKKREYREKGIKLKTDKRERRKILTINGMLEINRYKLRPAGVEDRKCLMELEKAKSIAPLDCFLGIAGLPFKMSVEMMLECAFWAQDQVSFQRAEEKILRSLRLFVNDDTVRLVSNYIGQLVHENDCLQAEKAWNAFCTGPFPVRKRRKGTLYIEVDGAAVNTRHKDRDGSTWRENKLAVFFSSDNIYTCRKGNGEVCRRIQKKEYVPYIGSIAEFKKHVLAGALRNGYGEYEQTVIISDGAGWIANMKEELFGGDAIHILDFFHLCENVYSYGKAKYSMNEKEYVPWAERICKLLKEGKWEHVVQKELWPEEKFPNTVCLRHYISENKDHINYPAYIAEGYFIGSGAVESSNKIIVQKRLKQAGMRWNPKTAQYILTLVAKWESELWESEVATPLYEALT